MPNCAPLSSHTQDTAIITKDNVYDLIPNTYSLSPGTDVTVSCVSGLRLVGSSSFSCLTNGQWSYSSKPYCTDQPEQTPSEKTLDDTSKIIIGVVCGIAGLIVIALIVMIVVIVLRDRRRRRERERLVQMWANDRKHEQRRRGLDGPSTIDMEMYTRYPQTALPPPYDYGYQSYERSVDNRKYSPRQDYDHLDNRRKRSSRSRSYDDLADSPEKRNPRDLRDRETERGSRLSNPMYLPTYQRQGDDRLFDNTRRFGNSKSYDDVSETNGKPYTRDWVSRNSVTNSEEYLSRPGVHGSRQGRDQYLWRNTKY
ncbi:uncharacterized protein LOC132739569 isoform X3 [Ruditapes philippinarum]|uniref:uncharacterized protein LOC132739569 isoform X3 n=1 Tax=Ruditapes philippinarum TaxID=129788 RepID=UPI00295B86CB|nr:uncharacterized protein LOC132739569 isoform X3 [Ruditapes philippinarum]